MLKRWGAALIAVTMLAPATASAQEAEPGAGRPPPRELRADDGSDEARPRVDAASSRGNWQRTERPALGPAEGQQRSDRTFRAPDVANNWRGRADHDGARVPGEWRGGEGLDRGTDTRPVPGPDRAPRTWQRPGADSGHTGTPPARGLDRQTPGRSQNRAPAWRGHDDNDRDWDRNRGWNGRGASDRRRNDWNDRDRERSRFGDPRQGSQWRGGYRDHSWNSGGWDGGRSYGWNRDWRHDRRYDWNAYRLSNRNLYRLPRYYAPYGWGYGYRRLGIGVMLDSVLFAQNYWIDDPWYYRLPPAEGPYRWVRYYNDALLVDVESGEVVDVIHDIFW